MVSTEFIRGSDPLDGIFCSIKDTITVDKAANQTWISNGDPKLFFCTTDAHNLYPSPPYQYQYIEFQLNGYYVKPTEYVLKGRSYGNVNLPTDWDILGYDGNSWIVLSAIRGDVLTQNSIRPFRLVSTTFFSAFRMRMQGKTTSSDWHLCIESIEFYGTLTTDKYSAFCRCSSCQRFRFHAVELPVSVLLSTYI